MRFYGVLHKAIITSNTRKIINLPNNIGRSTHQGMSASRESGPELLRIVSILLIVLSHSCICTFPSAETPTVAKMLHFGADTGVNCFILITGYFMINREFTVKKLFNLWLQLITYSVGFYILFLALNTNGVSLNFHRIYKYCMPLLSGHYWFISAYVLLLLISPFLNYGIKNSDKKKLFLLIIIISLFDWITASKYGGKLLNFGVLYSIAALIRLYENRIIKIRATSWFLISLTLLAIIEGLTFLGGPFSNISTPGKTGLPVLLLSVCLFMAHKSLNLGNISWINKIAACSFGVYLLHCHHAVYQPMWNFFNIPSRVDSAWFIPYCIGVSIIIYLACTSIEMIRIKLLSSLYERIIANYILPITHGLFSKIKRFLIQ